MPSTHQPARTYKSEQALKRIAAKVRFLNVANRILRGKETARTNEQGGNTSNY
ncbi:hypothetical protein [Vibrio metschnikovii]|uniref:hypothetical protein n=1 Tax=Vibrio metschnikovii TaxID=28172 RepID=UPI0029854D53|nr:hypothetical protein [Vibrio metschnikovii]EKO3608628.1 hypothetical protein [Vibrio metschnikovii]EKO3622029.1 hypothetical protein [Vibrio metschnikovii]EKO3625140.1 hypothetical protein [Vibrio metschnikovii]EKO3663167.1 hypothetical protein [Vibrio metschnikovii]